MMMETKPEVEMSDVANETQEPVTVSVEDLVNSIEKGDAFTSSQIFKDIVQSRIDDALEQEQIRIANSVYNGAEEEEPSEEETEAELESEVEAEDEGEPEVAEVEEPESTEEPSPEEPVAEIPAEEEHEEPEDPLGIYADEIEDILSDEESEDESEEEKV
jgi:hypothetical protein